MAVRIRDNSYHTFVERLTQARQYLTATTVGNTALFAGGGWEDRDGPYFESDVMDLYDATTNTWGTATLSQARRGMAATTVGSTALFAAGGWHERDVPWFESDVVDLYDSTTGVWSTVSLSQARYELAATTVGNTALFAGGAWYDSSNGTWHYSDVADLYHVPTNTWRTARLSQARARLTATTVGNTALFAGGEWIDSDGTRHRSDVVDLYDATTNAWRTARLSQARTWLTATTVGNTALFAGGGWEDRDGTAHDSDVVDLYDATTSTWDTATLSQARTSLAATTVGSTALFAGGGWEDRDGTAHDSDVVDLYDATTRTWSTATLSQARQYLTATTVGSTALFAGGVWTDGDGTRHRSDVVDLYTLYAP